MNKIFLFICIGLILVVGLFFYFNNSEESNIEEIKKNNLNIKDYALEDTGVTYGSDWENYTSNGITRTITGVSNIPVEDGYLPFNQVYNVSREGRFIKISGLDFNVTLDWGIILKNGQTRDSQWILENYPAVSGILKPKHFRNLIEWDFDLDMRNIPRIVRENVRGFYFNLHSAEGNINYGDVQLIDNVIYFKDASLSFQKEIDKGVDITINRTHIVYNNLQAMVVDGVFTSDPVIEDTANPATNITIEYSSISSDLDIELNEVGEDDNDSLSFFNWDRETSFNLIIPENNSELSWDNNYINKTYDDKVISFYTKSENEFEFDVIIFDNSENEFEFDLDTENLVYFYQGRLDDEENNYTHCNSTDCWDENEVNWIHRPIDVVGSYAVYHNSKANNEYKTGKAFHIYRPKVYDAEGNEVWGELEIIDNKLKVFVPQDFLDEATYPVRIDPSFGYTTVGAGSVTYSASRGHALSAQHYTASSGDTIKNFSINGYTYGSTATLQIAAYNLTSGVYDHRVSTATTLSYSGTVKEWHTTSGVSQSLTSGQTYGVAYAAQTGTNRMSYDSATGGQLYSQSSTLADVWSNFAVGTRIISMYASYDTGGAPPADCWTIESGKLIIPSTCKYYTNDGEGFN